ncbi:MAG: deoxyribodipyrimidine photo-lyase [Verrucomicrobia bacterium]|nr:deoxyribodipyrimidine photo-lyase [Verrucomicrobiota bacterium]
MSTAPHRFHTAIHWFRRDLRLHDNPALHAASRAAECVLPVYVVSAWRRQHGWTSAVRQEFLCGCLEELARSLATIGSRLIFRTAERADEALAALLVETGAQAIFFHRDPDPYGIAMEEKVAAMARRHGAEAFGYKDTALHERDELLNGSDRPYRVYGPYARAWAKLEKPAPVPGIRRLLAPPIDVPSEPAPTLAHWQLAPSGADTVAPGERAARARLTRFIEKHLLGYRVAREVPADEASSRLSQDLRWGLLSIREVVARCHELLAGEGSAALDATARESVGKFLGELAWRDFAMQLLFHFPEVLATEFNPAMRGLPWRGWRKNDAAGAADLRRWQAGETGFPLVDAGLRQLRATGFMHNRVRIVVAMFLTKDLRLHWRAGERFFSQRLVDGEIANNNMNWQWCAGTGADAAPYFRIQNPWTQSARHDPHGDYIRRWLPELRDVPAAKLHAPPAGPRERLAPNYPLPMVEHGAAREETLAMFQQHLQEQRQK